MYPHDEITYRFVGWVSYLIVGRKNRERDDVNRPRNPIGRYKVVPTLGDDQEWGHCHIAEQRLRMVCVPLIIKRRWPPAKCASPSCGACGVIELM